MARYCNAFKERAWHICLPAAVVGRWFFLYLIQDLFSRKIVGFEIHEADDPEHAVNLLGRTALAENLHALDYRPVLHTHNPSTLKATTVLAMMNWIGLRASGSRSLVSDDNSVVEALFGTASYRPRFSVKGFADLDRARQLPSAFVRWYNHGHRHSSIRYVNPVPRHPGKDSAVLQARYGLYRHARAPAPRRCARHTRHWNPTTVVTDAGTRAATHTHELPGLPCRRSEVRDAAA